MLNIEIKTIPHHGQRYDTCGDYWNDGDKEIFRVSELGDWRYEFLIAIHEMIEKALTRHKGIAEPDIKAFDEAYRGGSLDEPGDDKNAPYWLEHQIATGVERTLAGLLDVDWDDYEAAVIESSFKEE